MRQLLIVFEDTAGVQLFTKGTVHPSCCPCGINKINIEFRLTDNLAASLQCYYDGFIKLLPYMIMLCTVMGLTKMKIAVLSSFLSLGTSKTILINVLLFCMSVFTFLSSGYGKL